MDRACVYLVNDNQMYLDMAHNSIHMLRCHNPTIPIKIIFLPTSSRQIEWASRYDAEVIVKKPVLVPGEETYFPINKRLLGELDVDRLLFIDSDTFIFGDVNRIFDLHSPYSVVGCWNNWVYERGWEEGFLGIKPMNSGVMLWDTKWLKKACEKLPEYCLELRSGQTPLSKWLCSLDGKCWQREEFAFSLFIDRELLPHRYFMREECFNIQNECDFALGHKSIIFHTYTAQWQMMYDFLRPRYKLPASFIKPKRFDMCI